MMSTDEKHEAVMGDEPAFPTEITFADGATFPQSGMTKRELFAGMAMQGLLADGERDNVAEGAVEYADALLAALEAR